MKHNIKLLLAVFFLALIGSGLGTYGVLSYYNAKESVTKTNDISEDNTNSKADINEVKYTEIEKTEYTTAIEKAYNTVVEIDCETNSYYYGKASYYGSGVIITDDGYIVTNHHVVENVGENDIINVKLYNGEVYQAKIIGSDSRSDLAVIKIEAYGLDYATFADSSQLLLGQDVIAIGNPLGLGLSCSNGIISALEKEIYINKVYMNVMQTNAAVNAGNSGGGLFDINGNLVGIVNAKSNSSFTTSVEGIGYAIPSNTVSNIINELIENGYVKDRAALGVKIYTTANVKGALVSDVIAGGSAQSAGLQANDLIVKIDDTEITSYADLAKYLDHKNVGDTVSVTVERNNQELQMKVTLQASSNN